MAEMGEADIVERVMMMFGSEIAQKMHAPILFGCDVDVKRLYLSYPPIRFALTPKPCQFLYFFLIFRFFIHVIHPI